MESLRVAVGGKEDDCYDYNRPRCEGDGGRDWKSLVFSVSYDARHPLGAEGRLQAEVSLIIRIHWSRCQIQQGFSESHVILFCQVEVCFSLDILLIVFPFSAWIIFINPTWMYSSESFLPCTALEKAADSTEEHQTEVLAALTQVPAKASTFTGETG